MWPRSCDAMHWLIGAVIVVCLANGHHAIHHYVNVSKCCPQGEFLRSDEEYNKECVKQPLEVYNDLRRYHPYLRDFNLTVHNPCDRYADDQG